MKKLKSLLPVLFFFSEAAAQEISEPKITFSMGIEYRITPIYLEKERNGGTSGFIYYVQDRHLTGSALTTGINLNFKKIISNISIMNSIRYDHLYYKTSVDANGGILIGDEKRGFIIDYQLLVKKEFNIAKNIFYSGLGFSLMNNGTNFSYSQRIGTDPFGNPVYAISDDDFQYTAFTIPLGIRLNRVEIELLNRFSNRTKFFIIPGRFLQLCLKISYQIPLLKK
jgi:hypothetical protein